MMLLKLLNVFPVLEAEPGFGSLHSTLPIGAALHPAGLVAAIISRGSGVEVVPGDADDQQQQQQNTL
uniref:Putative secreted protein n=1 Tax=Anopheles triannulatus TaxID=58253 RepID=A0A2M4B0J8_9DIPT